jgi:hypothetical protein
LVDDDVNDLPTELACRISDGVVGEVTTKHYQLMLIVDRRRKHSGEIASCRTFRHHIDRTSGDIGQGLGRCPADCGKTHLC